MTLGTGNQVNSTDCFCVGSVGPTAGGLPQVTHSEHKEQSGNRGGKSWERTGGKLGNALGTSRNWEPSKQYGNCEPSKQYGNCEPSKQN